MAIAEQIRDLVTSFATRDDERFRTVALGIAAVAAKQGDAELANAIQDLIDRSRRTVLPTGTPRAVPIARPEGELSALVTASFPRVHLSDMVLSSDLRSRLERVLSENRQSEHLRSHGLEARRKLLLVGPPGCGKTMSAQAIAGETRLPLLVIQFHTLITRFMGETAAKLHSVFQAMQKTRGVYLFDEFDALGTSRLGGNDVGEARRIVNSFLQLLELEDSSSIIVAATNHVEALDHALFRRFDDILTFSLPSGGMAKELILNRLHSFGPSKLQWKSVLASARGFSHAEITRACEDAAKDAILAGQTSVTTGGLVASFRSRRSHVRQESRAAHK
mgnify:CR=1 FL=1